MHANNAFGSIKMQVNHWFLTFIKGEAGEGVCVYA